YLLISAHEDNPDLDIQDIPTFFRHVLERVDWRTDLHFQTCTTIDTLDYSGDAVNEGSKLAIAAVGPARRKLPTELAGAISWPAGFDAPKVCLPGILAVRGPAAKEKNSEQRRLEITRFIDGITSAATVNEFPLIVVVDNTDFVCESINN